MVKLTNYNGGFKIGKLLCLNQETIETKLYGRMWRGYGSLMEM